MLRDASVMSAYAKVVSEMQKEGKEAIEGKKEEKVERQREVPSHNTEFSKVMTAYQIVEKDMAANDIEKALLIAKQKMSGASPEKQEELKKTITELTSKLSTPKK